MAGNSTLILDYLGSGLLAARPAVPAIPTGGAALFYAYDVPATYVWDPHTAAWVTVSSSATAWTAAAVSSVVGAVIAGGTLTTDWNAGAVLVVGTNLALSAGTLSATGGVGSVTSVVSGNGLHAGTITTSGTLAADWNGGTVTNVGAGLSLSGGTLAATATPGVTSIIAVAPLNGGTITSTGSLGLNIGAGLSLSSGTLIAIASNIWNNGTVTASGDGVGINAGTIQVDHQGTITLSGTTTGTITPAEGVTSELVNVGTAAATISVGSGLYNGQHLRLEILQGATPQTVGFDSTVAFGADIPSYTATPVAAKRDLVQLIWNAAHWMFAAVNHGF